MAPSNLKVASILWRIVMGLSITCSVLPAHAQQKKDAADQRRAEQVRKLQEQNQQLQSDTNKAIAEKSKIESELKDKDAKTRMADDKANRLARDASSARAKLSVLEKKNEQLLTEHASAIEQLKTQLAAATLLAEQRLATADSQNKTIAKLQADLKMISESAGNFEVAGKTMAAQIQACSINNRNLVFLVDEVSDKYRVKSCADSRSLLEPVLGLRKAEFDRVAEQYRDKAGNERFVPEATKTTN
jgi:chromosome segregation ATPase